MIFDRDASWRSPVVDLRWRCAYEASEHLAIFRPCQRTSNKTNLTMAKAMVVVETPNPLEKLSFHEAIKKLDVLLEFIKDCSFPKTARKEANEAKEQLSQLCRIMQCTFDRLCEFLFAFALAGSNRTTMMSRRRKIVRALDGGQQAEVMEYLQEVKLRREEMMQCLTQLTSSGEDSVIARTTKALQALNAVVEPSFWEKHPKKIGALVGAILGGSLALVIVVPVLGWVGGVIGLVAAGAVVGGITGTAIAAAKSNEPRIDQVDHLEGEVGKISLIAEKFRFLDKDYDPGQLVISLKLHWYDVDSDLEDLQKDYSKIRAFFRRLKAAL